MFLRYFFKVFETLEASRTVTEPQMPFYFQFLTIMAFNVFVGEGVDCAIIEVGIGGENDCTNVLRNTKTAACTPLGLEHTAMLGNTLQEIAWQKAGIVKLDGTLFTSAQPDGCTRILLDRCEERNAKLIIVPAWNEYQWPAEKQLELLRINPAVRLNGSLALQLSFDWMRCNVNKLQTSQSIAIRQALQYEDDKTVYKMPLLIGKKMTEGLLKCVWPGRFHQTRYKALK